MRLQIEVDLDYTLPEPADVLLQVEAAALPGQAIEQADAAHGGRGRPLAPSRARTASVAAPG